MAILQNKFIRLIVRKICLHRNYFQKKTRKQYFINIDAEYSNTKLEKVI